MLPQLRSGECLWFNAQEKSGIFQNMLENDLQSSTVRVLGLTDESDWQRHFNENVSKHVEIFTDLRNHILGRKSVS